MTEEEWLKGPDVFRMLDYLQGMANGRKLRLFTCASCRRTWEYLTDVRSRAFVEALESQVDDPNSPLNDHSDEAFRGAWEVAHCAAAVLAASYDPLIAFRYASEAVVFAAEGVVTHGRSRSSISSEALAALEAFQEAERHSTSPSIGVDGGELMAQSDLLLDIFGNPFRPVTADPRWRTSTAVALARAIYADRAFDRLPILADALEEAGCDDADLHAHCRGDGPHVRGCWAVDLVLGKE